MKEPSGRRRTETLYMSDLREKQEARLCTVSFVFLL